MPHSSNGAGTHAAENGAKTEATTGLHEVVLTPDQQETLFGRKSRTRRLIAVSTSKQAPTLELEPSVENQKISDILTLATPFASPTIIRVKSKTASPHHSSSYNPPISNVPTHRHSARLAKKRLFSETEPTETAHDENQISESNVTAETQCVAPKAVTLDPPATNSFSTEPKKVMLSPETIRNAPHIPAVESNVKICMHCVTLQDVIDADEKPRTQPRRVFYGVSAQELAFYEETSVGNARYEWLHLLAHSFGGKFYRDNLVVGSRDANTIMTLYDHTAKYLLVSEMCTHIDIRIECTLKPKKNGAGFTHHAQEIRLSYKTADGFIFYSPSIDGDSMGRPTVELSKYILDRVKQEYLAYKDLLTKAGEKPAASATSSLWPPLPAAKPKPQEKPIYVYFPLQSKADASGDQPSLKEQKPSTPPQKKSLPNPPPLKKHKGNPLTPITAFFPSEKALKNMNNKENIEHNSTHNKPTSTFFPPKPGNNTPKPLQPLPIPPIFG